MSFNLLSEPIRRYIRDQGWDELRPIQNAAIDRIITSDSNYILASRTASGKTEAAFLPILTKVNFKEPGVQVLYISPLISLINDQFNRIEELCKYLDVSVTKWHGEANRSGKEKLIKDPNGIVLITPESIEAMFVNKTHQVKHLFGNLKYVVVDEVHAFIGTDRGIQLKSVLSRLQQLNQDSFKIVGLSATIGDYSEAKKFTGDELNTKVLLDRTAKEIAVEFRYFKSTGDALPPDLLDDLYEETKDNKVLIFPNSRGRTEEVAVSLKKIAARKKGHTNYFSHHSSVDREVREYVEYFAKNNIRQNFCISCTSTLELGIDIGSVDEVVQIDATHSIASLIQRVGRSGRKKGQTSNLFLYATKEWSLIQSIACWLLYKEDFIEPPFIKEKPFDILAHQILSIVRGSSGIRPSSLIDTLRKNTAFSTIEIHEVEAIITYLLENDWLEKIQQDLIIGVSGEKIVNHRDFYSAFKTEKNLKVINAGNKIGEIPFSPQIIPDENILLAAKIWKIKDIDQAAGKIYVIPANDGKKPMFFGTVGMTHSRVREKMIEILFEKESYSFVDNLGRQEINSMRDFFSSFRIDNIRIQRPLLVADNYLELFTFESTRINRTLQLFLNIAEIKNDLKEDASCFRLEISKEELFTKWNSLLSIVPQIDNHISHLLETWSGTLDRSKWSFLLPLPYQVELLKANYYDIASTVRFLETVVWVSNSAE
jgi:ATP-dependent Lhr-like helicase